MFGYVRIYKPDLKVAEYETYRGVYCSLCRTLGKRYGSAARMTLSFDFTFLALFIMAFEEEDPAFRKGYCSYNPMKKRFLCDSADNEALNFAADVAVLLTYHKLTDTVADERFFKKWQARLLQLIFKRDYKRAAKRRPAEAQAAKRYMRAQAALETNKESSIDAAAEPTAAFLSFLALKAAPLEDRETVARFGYCLGRYIYLSDAADDLEDDQRSGNYNPYLLRAAMVPSEEADLLSIRDYAAQTLHASVAVCAECYEQFEAKRFDGILRNVIYYGMPAVIKRIQCGQQEEKHNEKSV